MSWALENPCFDCKKKDRCTDYKKIQEAITEIHKDSDHVGGGTVSMDCFNLEKE